MTHQVARAELAFCAFMESMLTTYLDKIGRDDVLDVIEIEAFSLRLYELAGLFFDKRTVEAVDDCLFIEDLRQFKFPTLVENVQRCRDRFRARIVSILEEGAVVGWSTLFCDALRGAAPRRLAGHVRLVVAIEDHKAGEIGRILNVTDSGLYVVGFVDPTTERCGDDAAVEARCLEQVSFAHVLAAAGV